MPIARYKKGLYIANVKRPHKPEFQQSPEITQPAHFLIVLEALDSASTFDIENPKDDMQLRTPQYR